MRCRFECVSNAPAKRLDPWSWPMTGIDKRHCLKGGDDMTGHVTAVEIEAEDRDVRIEWGVGLDGSRLRLRLRLLTRSGPDGEWIETETVVAHGESVTVERPDGTSKTKTAAELIEEIERTLRRVLPMLDETAATAWKRSDARRPAQPARARRPAVDGSRSRVARQSRSDNRQERSL